MDLNKFAMVQFKKAQVGVKNNDLRALFSLSMYYRIISTYQAALILIERGNDVDAKALLRNLLESLFVLSAHVQHTDFVKPFLLRGDRKRVSISRRLIKLHDEFVKANKELFLTDEAEKAIKQSIVDYDKKNQGKPKLPDQHIEDIAKLGGVGASYHQLYGYLCMFAHSSAEGMADFLILDEQGKMTGIRTGQNDDDAEGNMRVAIMVIKAATGYIANQFNLGLMKELNRFNKRFDKVIENSHTQFYMVKAPRLKRGKLRQMPVIYLGDICRAAVCDARSFLLSQDFPYLEIHPNRWRSPIRLYAGKIQKTADGSRCCIVSQAGKTSEILPERRVKTNGEIDERKAAQGFCEDQKEEPPHQEKISRLVKRTANAR